MGIRKQYIERYDTNRAETIFRDNGRCVVCGKPFSDIHEILSRSMWATNDRDMALCFSDKNRVCICREHHQEYQGVPAKIAELLRLMQERYGYTYEEIEFVRYLE